MVLDNRHVLIGMLLALLVTEGSSQLGSGDKDNYVPGTVLPLGYGSGGPFQPDKDIVPDLDATHPPEAVVTSSSTTDPPEPVDSTKCNETFHFENGKYYVKTTREPFESPDTVAVFQCNLGFNLIGSQAILCDETPPAQWYKAPPTCQRTFPLFTAYFLLP
eukprot:scpid31546/ scgid5142/ 